MATNNKLDYDWCLRTFLNTVQRVQSGGTAVYEAKSEPINKPIAQRRVLSSVPPNSAVWQHTETYHVAMIYIEQGHGHNFGRKWLDLIASGVTTENQFRHAWIKENGEVSKGFVPNVKRSVTSQARSKQESFIVANLKAGENPKSTIYGNLHNVHRTHLISAQITGIEKHKGLLIDFDGWLNSKPLNDYEQSVIDLTKVQDVVWVATIWRSSKGLSFRYTIYNKAWTLLDSFTVTDDRWQYLWYYDKETGE